MSKRIETTLYSLSATAPHPPERRSEERFLSLLRVGALKIGDRRELCLIRNVSAGGMMIKPYSKIDRGTRLSVELKHGESVSGVAHWSNGGFVGIAFDEPIDVLALLSASGLETLPRMPRIELACNARLRQDAAVHRATALNISQGGICVRTNAEVDVGAQVIVSVTGLAPAGGVIKWCDDNCYGIGFNRVLSVGELMSFLQQETDDKRRRSAG